MRNTPTYQPVPDPANPGATHLWGHYVAMLTQGGDWAGRPGFHPWDWKPRSVYGIELPLPEVSNPATTSKIVNGCGLENWSRLQIASAMFEEANVGGAYLRYRTAADGDESYLDWLMREAYTRAERDAYVQTQRTRALTAGVDPAFVRGDTRTKKKTGASTNLVNKYPGELIYQVERDTHLRPGAWRSAERFSLKLAIARDLLLWLRRTGPVNGAALRECAVVSPRWSRTYADELAKAGLVTKTKERFRSRDGKNRLCVVYRVADEVPHLVDATDKPLWDVLRPSEGLSNPPVELDANVFTIGLYNGSDEFSPARRT